MLLIFSFNELKMSEKTNNGLNVKQNLGKVMLGKIFKLSSFSNQKMEISLIGILKLLQVYSTDLWPTKMINLSVMEYSNSTNGRTMRPKSKTLYERR